MLDPIGCPNTAQKKQIVAPIAAPIAAPNAAPICVRFCPNLRFDLFLLAVVDVRAYVFANWVLDWGVNWGTQV